MRSDGLGQLTRDKEAGPSAVSTRSVVGSRTAKSAIIYASLVRESSSDGGRRRILDWADSQLRGDGVIDPALRRTRYSTKQDQPAPAGFSLPEETKPQAAQRQVQDSMNRWQQVLGTRNRQDESPLSGVVPGLQIRLNQPVSCEPLARVEGSYQPRTRTANGFSAHGSQTAWPESCAHTSHTRRGALKLRTKAFPA